ncbi:hypothetical protein TRP8649_03538 [Pelagimonas phthalicica]|uniref:Uncharacterized protein n=1 Tax=Pelagimonas phthalicica TaxID=1037362 RepID=A0A238JGS7_9RHOB|nr:hypothetical protein [Pelagimonas phthalicica]TDS92343.1 hypothetical protein CLV87_3535 [Pelagimonas phthalicica]SMX29404.1 hypothetical protein TRP8649_03538 [Pelagimonas phthalicica]
MEFLSLLEALRNDYMTRYEAAHQELLQSTNEVVAEVAFELSEDSTVFNRLYVVDFLESYPDGPSAVEIAAEESDYSGPGSYVFNTIAVTMFPSSWDDINIELPIPAHKIAGFEPWFDRWMDIDGVHTPSGEAYLASIHSVILQDNTVFVDFGTAPVTAFTSLLDLLADNQITSVSIFGERVRQEQ